MSDIQSVGTHTLEPPQFENVTKADLWRAFLRTLFELDSLNHSRFPLHLLSPPAARHGLLK